MTAEEADIETMEEVFRAMKGREPTDDERAAFRDLYELMWGRAVQGGDS